MNSTDPDVFWVAASFHSDHSSNRILGVSRTETGAHAIIGIYVTDNPYTGENFWVRAYAIECLQVEDLK